MFGADSDPGIQLSLDHRTQLATTLNDLVAASIARSLSGDLLVNGTTDATLEVTSEVVAEVARLGEENMLRWRRLVDAAPFIVSLSDHVSDRYIEHGLRLAEMESVPGIAHFRQRAQAEGGPAAFVRARLHRVPGEFSVELDRAIALYRYFMTWPTGFRAGGPPESYGLATHDAIGCAGGIALVALGGIGIGATVATVVLTAGVATPVAFAAVGASSAAIGAGAAAASVQC
jgi:hypothetical protein